MELAKNPPASLFTLVTDQWTEPFWSAAAERRLVAPKCGSCGTFRMPPGPFCPKCRSQEIEWITLSGRGIVYSFTIVRHAVIPQMEDSLPYIPAVIELPDAGRVRLISNVVDADPETLAIGDEVRVVWDETSPGVLVPRFAPMEGAPA